VPDLPTPVAARLARARWLDPRLLVGMLLVLISVAVGAKVVAEADRTVPVWAVTRDLGAGRRLVPDDLVRRDVRLDASLIRYVRVGTDPPVGYVLDPPVGYVLIRPVGHDELLPAGAVARASEVELRRLVVEVDRVATTGLADGSVVDVYVVPEPRPGSDSPPPRSEVVLTGVTVDHVDERAGGLGGTGGRTGGVVLLVRPDDAREVLDAAARGSLRLLQVPPSGAGP
jgi:hypothetical protein